MIVSIVKRLGFLFWFSKEKEINAISNVHYFLIRALNDVSDT